jgi:mycothiol synthase
VISYRWRPALDAANQAAVGGLLAECERVDEEAGFPRPDPDAEGSAAHLLVWLDRDHGDPADPEPVLAAYLRLGPEAGAADYVVRPRLRSRGITTLLLEQMGTDPAHWAAPAPAAVAVLATGDHPAADRLCRRFAGRGVRRTGQSWQLIRVLRAGEPAAGRIPVRPASPLQARRPPEGGELLVADGGAIWFDTAPSYPTDFGPAARISGVEAAAHDTLTSLLAAALARIREAGPRTAVIAIDAADEVRGRACRQLGFMHDRTDTQYTLSGQEPRT